MEKLDEGIEEQKLLSIYVEERLIVIVILFQLFFSYNCLLKNLSKLALSPYW